MHELYDGCNMFLLFSMHHPNRQARDVDKVPISKITEQTTDRDRRVEIHRQANGQQTDQKMLLILAPVLPMYKPWKSSERKAVRLASELMPWS